MTSGETDLAAFVAGSYVSAGDYVMFIDDKQIRPPAGSFVYIPAAAVHGFGISDQPSRKLNRRQWWAASTIAAAIASGVADDERLGAIAERYGMEVVGPVPQGYL